MYEMKVAIKGIVPILMNNPKLLKKSLGGKAKSQSAYSEWSESQLYYDDKGNVAIYIKHWLEHAMCDAAKKVKRGVGRASCKEDIKCMVFVKEEYVLVGKNKPDYIDESYPTNKSGQRHYQEIPGFKDWKAEFTLEVFDDSFPHEKIREVLELTGLYKGIGARHPLFGRFVIEKFDEVKKRKAA